MAGEPPSDVTSENLSTPAPESNGAAGAAHVISIEAEDGSHHGCKRFYEQRGLADGGKQAQPQPGAPGWGRAVVQIESGEEEKRPWSVYVSSLPKKLRGAFLGGLDTRLPIPSALEVFWSWLGAFLGILAVSALNQWATPEVLCCCFGCAASRSRALGCRAVARRGAVNIAFTVGSFGASAVLIYAMLESKMAQPRNFVGGQLLSAVVGITTRVHALGTLGGRGRVVIHQPWIASPVAMSLALVVMMMTSTTHPPGGATALIAANLTTLPKWHGYSYLVTIGVGSLVMQVIALVVNNLNPRRRYPTV
eukprot:scaffold4.g4921.t1